MINRKPKNINAKRYILKWVVKYRQKVYINTDLTRGSISEAAIGARNREEPIRNPIRN
jgi:hypothetical protein